MNLKTRSLLVILKNSKKQNLNKYTVKGKNGGDDAV